MLNRMEMLRIFCAAAEAGSFREAATRLAMSPQGVTRAVKELEERLGEVLFHRNTRKVQITAFGAALAERARHTLGEVDLLFTPAAPDGAERLVGQVGITAPHAIGRLFLLRFLRPLMAEHPKLHFVLRFDDQPTDAVQAQIDIGVRVGFIRDRRYIARAAGSVPFHVVATPALIEARGMPASLDALRHCPLSALIDRNSGRPWPWTFSEGESFVPAAPVVTCDDPEAELEVVLDGVAFAQMPSYLAKPHLESGRLLDVLPLRAPPPWEVFVYRPQRGPVAPRVRRVYDHLLRCFADPAQFPQGPVSAR